MSLCLRIFTSWYIYVIHRHKLVNADYYEIPIGFTIITIHFYRLKTMNLKREMFTFGFFPIRLRAFLEHV